MCMLTQPLSVHRSYGSETKFFLTNGPKTANLVNATNYFLKVMSSKNSIKI